jgi:ATP-dependent helicase/nuclease subunit A
MSKLAARLVPPDQAERVRALDPTRSLLVQAPAGSGKTDLLARRFLRLLAEVNDPGQIVAITFTKAAAAEMRHRILAELEKAAAAEAPAENADEFSMEVLAHRALTRSLALRWQLPDLPSQLRVTTIDSFCRELAVQQPLVSGFGSDLVIHEQPEELYHRAARQTLQQISGSNAELTSSIEELLVWRDNNWPDLENQLVEMLSQRDRWMQDFVLEREPDWEGLRERLERPFCHFVSRAINGLRDLLSAVPHALDEALSLAQFACERTGGKLHRDLAERSEFPTGPFACGVDLEEARLAFLCLSKMLLTGEGTFRQSVDKRNGFPADQQAEKLRMQGLISEMSRVDGLESALAAVRSLPPARYTEDDWKILRACFTLLRHAAGELRTVFAEAGAIDFIEVAQIAQRVLTDEDGLPSDAAIAVAENIHHLLVDESQDTSRRQHRLLGSIAAAWSDQTDRTVFVVGDPMQSIYFFRDSDAELFSRLRDSGLDIPSGPPLPLDPVGLTANFRTAPALVEQLNQTFEKIFVEDDGSGIEFSPAEPAREIVLHSVPPLRLHLEFMPKTPRSLSATYAQGEIKRKAIEQRIAARDAQTTEIVALIRTHLDRIEAARICGQKYRIAVLGRAHTSLAPIALALREASIPFRAIELEQLKGRPEVLDALALARALLNPLDRVAWLGVLRAPWCGLPLSDLYILTSADDRALLRRPVPQLLAERLHLVSDESRIAVERILRASRPASRLRLEVPTASLGTWLEQAWLSLGGESCVDPAARTNLELLWSCLDGLPNGEEDLFGPALDAALDKLTALPDPAASSECGVQLMTIHKSKGLEFEVVIVPELQALGGTTRGKMLSWLERGLLEPDQSDAVTELLVAPFQSKGAERGKAKAWVDRVYRHRESQEMRRILYVAATRAREELHFFARPEYKDDAGDLVLVEPADCLLATAWPALAEQVRTCFEQWKSVPVREPDLTEGILPALAASGNGNLIKMPPPSKPTLLRRLPIDFQLTKRFCLSGTEGQDHLTLSEAVLYTRHEGGALSRALGSAVHKLLEQLASLRLTHEWDEARAALTEFLPRIKAQMRAIGASQAESDSIARKALDYALLASNDPYGQWILSPHAAAASEAAWTGIVANTLRSVRVDRLFRAGLEPLTEDDDAWWIIDYKTVHAEEFGPLSALSELRSMFAPQLEAYSAVLRNVHDRGARIRAALYYPRMALFDWWEIS